MAARRKSTLTNAEIRIVLARKKRGVVEVYARIPRTLRPGKVLVHNHVHPDGMTATTTPARQGFRVWFERRTRALRVCRCGWAPHLPRHYRMAWCKAYRAVE